MLSNILNIYCKNIFNNFLIAESCRSCTHLFQKLPSPAPAPAPAPAPESRNAPVLHSATPTYTMSSFLVLKNLCEEMDAMVRKFQWKPNKEGNHWDPLCQAKRERRVGLRQFYNFNLALLTKLVQWIVERKKSRFIQK